MSIIAFPSSFFLTGKEETYLGSLFLNLLKQILFFLYILVTSASASKTGQLNCLAT
ncbi:uncharacterized protein METZ01_LOCUS446020 [marine metagenome]|uniref:Uncharacterized protein n=1 Tax=marine metagenome TaxID=408172 RepID=A0A382ZCC3_9ZZZZ